MLIRMVPWQLLVEGALVLRDSAIEDCSTTMNVLSAAGVASCGGGAHARARARMGTVTLARPHTQAHT